MEDCGRMYAATLHAANWSKLRERGRRRREQAADDRSKDAPAEEPPTTAALPRSREGGSPERRAPQPRNEDSVTIGSDTSLQSRE